MSREAMGDVLFVRVPKDLMARLDAYVDARKDQEMSRARAARALLDKALGDCERRAAK